MSIDLTEDEGGARDGTRVGEWLTPGWYAVTVESFREFSTPNNPKCVEYILRGGTGKAKAAFFISPKAKYRLKLFAQACGLEDASLKVFEYGDIVGCEIEVEVVQDGKFTKVDNWKAI